MDTGAWGLPAAQPGHGAQGASTKTEHRSSPVWLPSRNAQEDSAGVGVSKG